jgi:uncharacterized protein involved in exopolysaccharide biosynthesis
MAAREQNQVQEVVSLLRRRALQIFLPVAVTGAIGWALAELWPRTYYAETKLEVRDVTPPVASQGIDAKVIQRDIDNARWQVKQFERIVRVLEKLEWREYKELTDPSDRTEYIRELIERIQITSTAPQNKVAQGSILLTISYKDNDAQRAEQFLNRLREVFVSEVLDRYRSDARKTLDLLRNQQSLAEGKAKDADAAAAKLKKEAGVSATQQAPGGGRQRDEDPIFKRLDTAQSRLFEAEASVAGSLATIEQLKKLLDETPAEVPQSQVLGGFSFDDEVAAIETAKIEQRDRQQGLLPAHKTYQDAEYKLRKLDEKLEQLMAVARAPETDTRMAPNPARAELQDRIRNVEVALSEAKALKARMESEVQTLKVESAARVEIYRQLQDLDRQAAIASDEYLRAAQAYGKQKDFVEFIGSTFANPFEVSEIARAPKKPISPNGVLFIGGGLIAGLVLGLGSSLIAEFGRNGVRNASEAARIAGAPVLGVINRIRTRREKRDRAARRMVVVVSTLAISASVLWTTWAYKNEPQALGVSLRSALDRFRESLR